MYPQLQKFCRTEKNCKILQRRNTEFTFSLYCYLFGVGPSLTKWVHPTVIFQLIYTCALTRSVSGTDLELIAETSRARNQQNGITGMLLCKDGSVLQVLEGEKTAITALYKKISEDHRITKPLILIQRETIEREFPKWSMGFKNADETESAFKLCARTFPDALPENVSPEVSTISRTFAKVNGLT